MSAVTGFVEEYQKETGDISPWSSNDKDFDEWRERKYKWICAQLAASRAEVEALKNKLNEARSTLSFRRDQSARHRTDLKRVTKERDECQDRSSQWAAECGKQQASVSTLRARLAEAIRIIGDVKMLIDNAKFDFRNGVTDNGMDEGEVKGMKFLEDISNRIEAALSPESPAEPVNVTSVSATFNGSDYGKESMDALDKMAESPKTVCAWKRMPDECDEDYSTSCGKEVGGEYTVEELAYKFCPYCGRPIVEKQESGQGAGE